MSSSFCVAATLSPTERQELALQVLTKTESVTSIAQQHQVSRKFLYQQSDKANDALTDAFATSDETDDDVLFHLPVTKAWLFQLLLSLVLICHSSFRGVVELFRDLFDFHISVGTIQNAMKQTPRASSLVENLNSRLRNYFSLRKHLGTSYLDLLQFFLNHRRFMSSDCDQRQGKSPKEVMTGEKHPYWLEMLGFKRFQRA